MSTHRRAVAALALGALALLAGCSSSGTRAGDSGAAVSPSAAPPSGQSVARGQVPCHFAADGVAARTVSPPATSAANSGTVDIDVATDRGAMTLQLNRAAAPCTVASFVSLVKQGFYDKTPCHRLVTAGIYVLQCGDPTGTGSGGPGYSVPDEATGSEQYPAGTVAMARTSAPDSGGSQFFIVYKDSPNLMQGLGTLQYTVFGTVAKGLSVVTKVAAAGASTGTDGAPKLPVEINAMTLAK